MDKNILTCFVLFLFLATEIFAQPIEKSTPIINREVASQMIEEGYYENAIDLTKEARKEDKENLDDVVILAEMSFKKIRDYNRAESYYERILRKDKRGEYSHLRYDYGRVLKMNGKYQEARIALNEYIGTAEDPLMIKRAKNEIKGIDFALKSEPRQGVVVDNIGENINCKSAENGGGNVWRQQHVLLQLQSQTRGGF